jgi:Flp pilus assembly protein TadG
MVPVLFGMMGFAIDLGRLYLVRGELHQAANAMALTAASRLLGTAASNDAVLNAVPPNGPAYTYNFGSLPVGSATGNLNSTVNPPACFATVADATSGTGSPADCSAAQFVQVSVTADAPLLFWSLLPGGQSRKTTIAASAVAGISTPLCTACGVVPMAIAAQDSADTVNWGFIQGSLYTLYYQCTGTPTPVNFAGTTSPAVPYEILNRYDANNATLDDLDQLYQIGSQGLVASVNPTPNACTTSPTPAPLACINVGDCENLWVGATTSGVPAACASRVNPAALATLCGIRSRLSDNADAPACATGVTDFAALSTAYVPDIDTLNGLDVYTGYAGNGRRIITVAIVDTLATNSAAAMTVLGFRQFLVEPNSDGTFFEPGDPNGRFPVMYIGNPAPVQQGWFDTRYAPSCPTGGALIGPGKVVLHQ